MTPWESFYPDVLPYVPKGTPDPLVTWQLRRAAQSFCRSTRAWRTTLDAVSTAAGQLEYDIEFPPGAELVRVESASLGDQPLTVWRSIADGQGQFVATRDGKTAVLSQQVAEGLPLVLTVTLTPSDTASGIESDIFDRYSELIANEALARITGDGARHERFLSDCATLRVDLWRGTAATQPRTRANWF